MRLNLKKSYWSKLMLSYMIIISIPLLLIGFLLYMNAIQIIKQQTNEYKTNLMQLMNEKIDAYVSQLELLSLTVYQDEMQSIMNASPGPDELNRIRHKNHFFYTFEKWAGFMGTNGKIEDIIWIRNDGTIYSYSNSVQPDYPYTKTTWYKKAMQSNGTAVIIAPDKRSYSNFKSNETYLSLARKVNSTEHPNDNLGVILINVKMTYINQLLDPLKNDGNNIFIMNEAGEHIYSQGNTGALLQPITALLNASHPSPQSKSEWVSVADQRYLYTQFYSPKTHWFFVSMDSLHKLTESTHYIRNITFITGGVAFLVAFIVSLFQSWRIVKPIRILQKSMRKVQTGQFETQAKVYSDDEIGELTTSFNEMVLNTNELIQQVYQAEIKEKEAYLQALQAQINPHFLYNSLDSINMLATIHRVPEIGHIAKLMADMFRYNTNTIEKEVTLSEELTQVTRYVDLVLVRLGDKIQLNLDIPSSLLSIRILKFTLQPLVENAVKHGLELKPGPGHLQIKASMAPPFVIIEIKDDGIGIHPDILHNIQQHLNTHTSHLLIGGRNRVGIQNVKQRLQLHYGHTADLQIHSEHMAGTEVVIKIPDTAYSDS